MRRLYLVFFILSFIAIEATAKPLHFALLSARDSQDAFWGPVENFAQQAAKQLEIKLTILHTKNSKRAMFTLLETAKKLNVDAVIFANFGLVAPKIMQQAEQQKTPVFLFNSGVTEGNKQETGTPQEKFKYWLGSLIPDDKQAGYLQGKYLIEQARLKHLGDENGMVEVIAINGSIADTPAILRLDGLKKAIKEDGNSKLLQNVYAYWLQETAYYKALHLSKRYPKAKVYWTASDLMAMGVNQAFTENGLEQGKDYLTGGVDWSKEGLAAIKKGLISTSTGGHFMDAAWAVIMLYDHFNGSPLSAETAYQFQSPMSLIEADDIDLLLPHLEHDNWKDINFRLRSKVLNKELKAYNFSPASILEELKETQD